MVRLQTLDLRIGVRVPASQPHFQRRAISAEMAGSRRPDHSRPYSALSVSHGSTRLPRRAGPIMAASAAVINKSPAAA